MKEGIAGTREALSEERTKAQVEFDKAWAAFTRYAALKGVPRKSVNAAAGIPLFWQRKLKDLDAQIAALPQPPKDHDK
jgi:hypothetical protein